MIDLSKYQNYEVTGLLLQNQKLKITKTIEDFILINDSIDIIVSSNVKANIVDMSLNKDIKVIVDQDAFLNYHIIKSYNSNRVFENSGTLEIMQISLSDTKEELLIKLNKENSVTNVSFLSISKGSKQFVKQNVLHLAKSTSSNISNYAVAMDCSNITLDTTGSITKGMSKSKCQQLSKGIVMDDDSVITSKPILLIDEYDVFANHGASIGKMSDESLFYLMSRGLSKTDAFLLILEGIIRPFIARIADEELSNSVDKELQLLIKR